LENEKAPVSNIINRTFNAVDPQTGTISGQTAYNIVKDMRSMGQGAGQDSTLRNLAGDAQGALLDGINSSLSGPDLAAFTLARQQQAIMHKVEGALPTEGTGVVSPAKLANVMGQKSNRSMSVYGQGPQDLVDLAQAGKAVLGDKTPNSGTTARLWASTVLPGIVAGGADLGYGLLNGEDLSDALMDAGKFAGGAVAAPKGAQFLLNSPRAVNILSQGVTQPVVRGLLEAPKNNALAGQAVRAVPDYFLGPSLNYALRSLLTPPLEQKSLQP
jgi:hypothetical protein